MNRPAPSWFEPPRGSERTGSSGSKTDRPRRDSASGMPAGDPGTGSAGTPASIGNVGSLVSLGRLTASVVHDFNNLLTIISGYTELLITDESVDPTRQTFLEQIKTANDRATRLTRQLLTISRDRPPELVRTELGEVVRDSEDLLRRFFDWDCRLVIRTPEYPIVITADPILLQQMMLASMAVYEDIARTAEQIVIEVGLTASRPSSAEELPAVLAWHGELVLTVVLADDCVPLGGGLDDVSQRQLLSEADLEMIQHLCQASGGTLITAGDLTQACRITARWPLAGDPPASTGP